MARNKSEQLPSCATAHAYLKQAESFLADGTGHFGCADLWFAIPRKVRVRLETGIPIAGTNGEDLFDGDVRWRTEIVRRIRAWYAA